MYDNPANPPAAINAQALSSANIASLRAEIRRLQQINPVLDLEEVLPAMLGCIHQGGFAIYSCEGVILSAWLPLELQLRLGVDINTLLGRNLAEILPPEAYARRMELVREVAATGEARVHEFLLPSADGDFWFQSSIVPLRDAAGRVSHMVTFFLDITAHKQAELSREESDDRYRGIVENSLDAVMLTRPDGVIEYMSPATQHVLGWRPEDLAGTRASIVYAEDKERVKKLMQSALQGASGNAEEYRIVTANGEVRWISHSWSPIMAGNRLKMIVSMVRDVSDRKRLEQELRQAERLAAIGQTIADVAHQLKTICLNIRGSASMIEKALDARGSESIRTLWGVFQRSSDRLANLALGMLEYGGLETLQRSPVDVDQLLRELYQEWVGEAARRNVKLRLNLQEREQPVATADRGKLCEVFTNLISNAIDACEERTAGLVDIQSRWDETGQRLRVAVIDNGRGIPPEIQGRIFDPFFTTKGAKGNGLGLAVALKSVQLHGGTIEVDSGPARTALTVVLPVA